MKLMMGICSVGTIGIIPLIITMAEWTECMNFGITIARQASKVGGHIPLIWCSDCYKCLCLV